MDSVHAVTFSRDSKQVASGSLDKTVRLWDAATGAALLTLEGHTDCVCSVALSPDGKQLASASWDGTVRLWDAATGEVLQTLKGYPSWVYVVNSVTFSPDGKQLALASDDRTVRLWDATTGAMPQTLKGHTDEVTAVAFSPDGKQLASASWDKTVRLWDALAGSLRGTLQLYAVIQTLSFSSDGSYLETDRGLLNTGSLSPSAVPSRSNPPYSIFVEEQWVAQGMENFLWLRRLLEWLDKRRLSAFFYPDAVIDRKVLELLHQSAGPADGRGHGSLGLAQAKAHVLAVLRKKSRPGLQRLRLILDHNNRADSIGIAFDAAQPKRDGRR